MSQPQAAVAIVHACGSESVLLIRRTEREEDPWSGHWSFPGGRAEAEDRDLVHTALRELAEECGVHLQRETLEASLPPMMAGRRLGRNMLVAPFLFRAESELPTVLDPEEAVEAQWIPLSLLRDPARHSLRSVPRLPKEMAFPAIELNGVPLWGFTYRVISEWLGLNSPQTDSGFAAARLVLEFLLARGLQLEHGWSQSTNGGSTMTAGVKGLIPVAAVLASLSQPRNEIPALSVLEVRPELIRVVGLGLEEYRIEASH